MLHELEAEVGRTEALYAAVTEEERVAEEEGSALTAVRTRLEREMVQIGRSRQVLRSRFVTVCRRTTTTFCRHTMPVRYLSILTHLTLIAGGFSHHTPLPPIRRH